MSNFEHDDIVTRLNTIEVMLKKLLERTEAGRLDGAVTFVGSPISVNAGDLTYTEAPVDPGLKHALEQVQTED